MNVVVVLNEEKCTYEYNSTLSTLRILIEDTPVVEINLRKACTEDELSWIRDFRSKLRSVLLELDKVVEEVEKRRTGVKI